MPKENIDRIPIPPRPERAQHIVIGFDRETRTLLESLLSLCKTVPTTLRRLEKTMAKIDDALAALGTKIEESNAELAESFRLATERILAALENQVTPEALAKVTAYTEQVQAAIDKNNEFQAGLTPEPPVE